VSSAHSRSNYLHNGLGSEVRSLQGRNASGVRPKKSIDAGVTSACHFAVGRGRDGCSLRQAGSATLFVNLLYLNCHVYQHYILKNCILRSSPNLHILYHYKLEVKCIAPNQLHPPPTYAGLYTVHFFWKPVACVCLSGSRLFSELII